MRISPWLLLVGTACADSDSKSSVDSDTGLPDPVEPGDSGDSGDTSTPEPQRDCGDFAPLVELTSECVHTEEEGPMEVTLKWEASDFIHFPEFNEVLMTPLVMDIDADGEREVLVVGDQDDNDGGTRGALHIVDGDGDLGDSVGHLQFETEWTNYRYHPYRFTNLAAGDVDQDGLLDIVLVVEEQDPPHEDPGPVPECDPILPPPPENKDIRCKVGAVSPSGQALWISQRPFECGAHAPALVDLEGDGTVEVVMGPAVLEGADGAERFWLPESSGNGRYDAYAEIGYHSVAADLDGDGVGEIIAGSSVYRSDGSLACNVEVDGAMGPDVDGFSAPFLPADNASPVYALVGNGMLRIVSASCEVETSVKLEGSGNGGPPTIADFTGDGRPDVAVANSDKVAVYTTEGELVWSEDITDISSHALGLMAFDFEGDGRIELVYADEFALTIRDGRTGSLRFADSSHTSRTAHEYPVIADVDDDGRPDLIVPNGGSHYESPSTGFYVLQGVAPEWLGGPSDWNQHAYESPFRNPLNTPGDRFRSADQNPNSLGLATNLQGFAEWCPSDASEAELLHLGVANTGALLARDGVASTLYAVAADGSETPILELTTADSLEEGALHVFEPQRIDLGDSDAVSLIWRVDDASGAQRLRECDESDNAVALDPSADG